MNSDGTQVEPATNSGAAREKPRPARLDSINFVRGLVMILMALDHVRDFFSNRLYQDATDLTTTTPANFLTRWITHYCAPTFIFLAGTSAFLSGSRGKSKSDLSWFLLTRGIWLAFFEVVVNRMLWMFNFDFHNHGAGVFWAIGWSMIALSILVFLPTLVVTLFGVALILLHNCLDGLSATDVHLPDWLWMILHSPGDKVKVIDGYTFSTGYCLIPWLGVMAAGYGFGTLMLLDRASRRPLLFLLGIILTLGFIILRAMNVYGDPSPWSVWSEWSERLTPHAVPMLSPGNDPVDSRVESPLRTFLSFLNCTKYPASLLYLLMTLGPMIFVLAIFDGPLGSLARPVITFGRVPLFFYLLHIPLIHGGAVLLDYARFGWSPLAADGPWGVNPAQIPSDYGVSLPVVYLIWVGVVLILYLPCRWFAAVKRRRRDVWLSYL